MPRTLRSLAWVTLAFVGGTVVVLTLSQCNPNAAESDIGCVLGKAQILLLTVAGSCLTALFLGVTACRTTMRRQRGGWFVSFLWLTMLLVAAPTVILVILNVPLFPSTVNGSLLLWAVFLLPPALALLTFVYLRATSVTEQNHIAPDSREATGMP